MDSKAKNAAYYAAHRAEIRERQRAYYKERRNSIVDNRHRTDKVRRVPDTRDIVFVDGEGASLPLYYFHLLDGRVLQAAKPTAKLERASIWYAQKHIYNLLMASTGDMVKNPDGLSTIECFEFLLSLAKRDRILASYAFTYDVNMILRDLPKERLEKIHKFGNIEWREYSITWIPRKQFVVKRGSVSVCVWDIFGYFQSRFVDALGEWKIAEQAIIQQIDNMKAQRGNFHHVKDDDIERYCLSECVQGVALMRRLLVTAENAGIVPRRYDGAGSLAATLLQNHRVADYLKSDESLEPLALKAYFGGRFEMRVPGFYAKAYSYDINSAYPAALVSAPCLTCATWENRSIGENEIGLAKVEWDIAPNRRSEFGPGNAPKIALGFGPFPWRNAKGSISYPARGIGTYWYHECQAAMKLYPGKIRVLDSWVCVPHCEHTPFGFLPDLFEQRRILKRNGDLGHLILKLGYNSMYGKTAQNVGGRGKPPKYRNWLIASYTTSHCRAKILDAIRLSKGGVISIATDGVISEKPIKGLTVSDRLGEWEYGELTDCFMVRPNLYALTEDGKRVVKAGGMAKKETPLDDMANAFKEYGPSAEYRVKLNRFMTLGAAIMRSALKTGWGCWITEYRKLAPSQHNRIHLSVHGTPPYDKLPTCLFLGDKVESKAFSPKTDWGGSFEEQQDILAMLLDVPD